VVYAALTSYHAFIKNCLVKYAKKQHKFLPFFLGAIEYAFIKIQEYAKEMEINLSSDEVMLHMIIQDFRCFFEIAMYRILLVEMHMLKAKNALKGESSRLRFDDFLKIILSENNIETLLSKYCWVSKRVSEFICEYIKSRCQFLKNFTKDFKKIM